MTAPRYAIYYTPPPLSALARFGAGVLGYDCFEGIDVPRESFDGMDPARLEEMTAGPRRYGFHATIVAPFRLAQRSEDELVGAAEHFAARTLPVTVGALVPGLVRGFVALVPSGDSPAVSRLAAECLEAFQPFRAPLSASDRQRRVSAGLTPVQMALLDRWGYPYVLGQFQFHMTLAGPVPGEQGRTLCDLLWQAYRARAAGEVEIDAISVMRQDAPGARFRVLRRCRLGGG